MKYWALMVLMALSGSVFAKEIDVQDDDIEIRIYTGVTYDTTTFSVVHDTIRNVTCYITESQSAGSSPAQTCFPDGDIR